MPANATHAPSVASPTPADTLRLWPPQDTSHGGPNQQRMASRMIPTGISKGADNLATNSPATASAATDTVAGEGSWSIRQIASVLPPKKNAAQVSDVASGAFARSVVSARQKASDSHAPCGPNSARLQTNTSRATSTPQMAANDLAHSSIRPDGLPLSKRYDRPRPVVLLTAHAGCSNDGSGQPASTSGMVHHRCGRLPFSGCNR